MKSLIAAASAAFILSFAAMPSIADDQTSTDPARHTMGDEGKLPSSGAVSGRVPDMGAGTGSSTGTAGSSHRMGDEGKLPATDSMSGQVPKMSKPAAGDN
ncbi:MAG: hypothetical protein JSR78_16915 [Proteobacteria bacterium]|nr:hypothetical protein [Pseudomonadota bacterium]